MCGAAPASVRKTAAPFSHARVLDIRPAAGGRGRELGFCRREGGLREREREPSSAFPPVFIVLLLIGTFRPSLARKVPLRDTHSVCQSVHLFFGILRFQFYVSLRCLGRGSPLASPSFPALFPHPLARSPARRSLLFLFFPKESIEDLFTSSWRRSSPPPPPSASASFRLCPPSPFAFFHVAPSRFCSFSAVVVQRRFT